SPSKPYVFSQPCRSVEGWAYARGGQSMGTGKRIVECDGHSGANQLRPLQFNHCLESAIYGSKILRLANGSMSWAFTPLWNRGGSLWVKGQIGSTTLHPPRPYGFRLSVKKGLPCRNGVRDS